MNSFLAQNSAGFAAPAPIAKFKTCIKCGATKPLHEFSVQPSGKSHRNDCKQCCKERRDTVRQLKKTAPPKPTHCECCGKETDKLVLDHDHNTNEFRGWVCDACNRGMGFLGDDITGALNMLSYLHRPTKTDKDA